MMSRCLQLLKAMKRGKTMKNDIKIGSDGTACPNRLIFVYVIGLGVGSILAKFWVPGPSLGLGPP